MLKSLIAIPALLTLAQAAVACPTGTTASNARVEEKPVCIVKGSYLNTTLALSANFSYVLEGDVRIGADNAETSVLSIEPGTRVFGTNGSYLLIMRGSKIMANGSKKAPVVFTSLERTNQRPGLWGGIVINGNAPINACKPNAPVCEAVSEGIKTDPPKFGGSQPHDNSGRLSYVRVEFAGFELAKDNELNGITFNGVGDGTMVDHIQVHMNADDGIELFGGTVNLRYVLLTQNDDDGLDWDMGWTGNAQFVMIEMENGSEDMHGIEADNLKSPMDAQPRSNPTLSNVTISAKGTNPRMFSGIMLRRGTGGAIHNSVVTGNFKVACINIDDVDTYKNGGVVNGGGVSQTGLKITHSVVHCPAGNNFDDKDTDPFLISKWFDSEGKSVNRLMDPELIDGRFPKASGQLIKGAQTPQVNGTWKFTPVKFVGAFSANTKEDWTVGWTVK